MSSPVQAGIFSALPLELQLHICRCVLITCPSRHSHLRLCCKDWKLVVDNIRVAIAFPVERLGLVGPYLHKLPSLAAVSLSSKNTDNKVGRALTLIHCLAPGLTSLVLRHDSRSAEQMKWGAKAAKLNASLRGLVLPWRYTLRRLELENIRCPRRVILESGGSSGGFSFLSELPELKSLMLTDITPVLCSIDLAGCASLQTLRVVRRRIPTSRLKLDLSVCTALREVDLEGCRITRLNVSGCTQLERLNCSMNNISRLRFPHHPQLKELLCESNRITSLQLSECPALELLLCADNAHLTTLSLPDSASLRQLSCWMTDLRTVDLLHQTALQSLSCGGQRLRKLNFSECKALRLLECSDLKCPSLDLRSHSSLQVINLHDMTRLKTLNVAGLSDLRQLQCHLTPIAKLDVTGCSKLEWLNLESKTKLTRMDLSKCDMAAEPHVLMQRTTELVGASGCSKGSHTITCETCRIENVENSNENPNLDGERQAYIRNVHTLTALGLKQGSF